MTGPSKPGESTIVMFGSAVCAGFGAQTPWYNQTGMRNGWAFDLAAPLHSPHTTLLTNTIIKSHIVHDKVVTMSMYVIQ